MERRSHVDIDKIKAMPKDRNFEYRDVVDETFPATMHSEDSQVFNNEVESGLYDYIEATGEDSPRVTYKRV